MTHERFAGARHPAFIRSESKNVSGEEVFGRVCRGTADRLQELGLD